MPRVTIKDVAEAAGVSPMTVSRVLNNRPDVSRETREHVRRVIEELGYAPNVIARSLSRGHSHTLGVVGTGIDFYGPSRTLVGIERQANALGYSLLLSLVQDPENDRGEKILHNLLSHQVAGILWAVPEMGANREWLCERVRDFPVPIVFLNMQCRPGTVTTAVDNYAGGRLATEHLLAQGCRRIGIITGPMSWWEAQQRELGWRSAMQEAGVPDLDLLKVYGDWSAGSGKAGMLRLLDQCPDLEAVFACNDQMALGALQAARQANLRVPEDLALVGFDDIPEAEYFSPPLTTIRQDLIEMGSRAVLLLAQALEAWQNGESFEPEPSWVQPQLIVRDSSIWQGGNR